MFDPEGRSREVFFFLVGRGIVFVNLALPVRYMIDWIIPERWKDPVAVPCLFQDLNIFHCL